MSSEHWTGHGQVIRNEG